MSLEFGKLVLVDPKYGYRTLPRIPPRDELEAFYRVSYPFLVDTGQRVINKPDRWLQATVWADVVHTMRKAGIAKKSMVLDVGAGDGAFVDYLASIGYDAQGCDVAWENGTSFHQLVAAAREAKAQSSNPDEGGISACTMLHYLAHDPDPIEAIRGAWDILRPGGMLFIRTGNDFNPLQTRASEAYGMYWVNAPDIINYFSQDSLLPMLVDNGFRIFDRWNDFPIETFLLDGIDYVNDPKGAGEIAHSLRVSAEMAMTPTTRRCMNRAYATMGIGRCAHVAAVKVSK